MVLKLFFPAYVFALFMWLVASLPGDDLQKVQQFPENLWLMRWGQVLTFDIVFREIENND